MKRGLLALACTLVVSTASAQVVINPAQAAVAFVSADHSAVIPTGQANGNNILD